jgi:hypothetical protein
MVWDQGPCVALGLGFFQDDGETIEERLPVLVVSEKLPSFNSPSHYVLKETGSVKSGLPWHLVYHRVHRDHRDCYGTAKESTKNKFTFFSATKCNSIEEKYHAL